MLKKIFKTIFIMSLCVGISLPTNAAVSVSDGSAFVTKAEFAADLNNLSNRMAQLENSLDAKIDSLVSSYLTRNGIWNGAKQTLNQVNMGSVGVLRDNTTAHTYRYYSFGNTSFYSAGTVNSYSGAKVNSINDLSGTLINNTTKSGMMQIIYDVKLTLPDKIDDWNGPFDSMLQCAVGGTNDNIYGDWVNFLLGGTFQLLNSDSGEILFTDIRLSPYPVPSKIMEWNSSNNSAYMFVSKGDPIGFLITNKSSAAYVAIMSEGIYYTWRVNSAVIY